MSVLAADCLHVCPHADAAELSVFNMLPNAFAFLKSLLSRPEGRLLLIPRFGLSFSFSWSFSFLSEDVNFSCSQSIFSAVAFYMKHLGVKTRAVDSKKSRGGFFRRQLVKVQQCVTHPTLTFVSPAACLDFSEQERRIQQSQTERSVSRHPQLDSRQQYVLP